MFSRCKIEKIVSSKSRKPLICSISTDVLQNIRDFDSIPRPPHLPVVGHWYLYKLGIYNNQRYHRVLHHLYKKYGPIVYEKVGLQKPVIHVFEPEDAEIVYRNEDKMPRIYPLSEITKEYRKRKGMSVGLGNTNDEDWYQLVNGVRHLMLKTKAVQQFFDDVNLITDDLIETIREKRKRDGRVDDLRQLLGRWSLELAGKICFDTRLGHLRGQYENQGEKIVNANSEAFRLGTALKFSLALHDYFVTPKFRKFVKNEDVVHGAASLYANEALSKIKSQRADENKFVFLRTLLQKPELSVDDVKIIATSLFVDGLSTTIPTLMSNLYALATNEQVQNRVYEEICAVEASNENNLKKDSNWVNKLTYLKAVIKETFRIYPNGTEIGRINKKPLVLSGYYIPAETQLSLNMLVHFKSEKYFSDPYTFKPERWLRGVGTSNVNPFVLTPFGYGARTCAGRKFAEQDLLVSLYKIVKNFRLTYPTDAPVIDHVFHMLLFPNPKIDMPICFFPRN